MGTSGGMQIECQVASLGNLLLPDTYTENLEPNIRDQHVDYDDYDDNNNNNDNMICHYQPFTCDKAPFLNIAWL